MQDTETPDLNIYQVLSRITGESSHQVATNAQDACLQAGWKIDECYVHPLAPYRRAGPGQQLDWRVKIPCKTCPFQYATCTRPNDEACDVKPQAPELNEWLKQAAAAHLCPYQGDVLSKKDHQLSQKWVTMEQAIKELAPQSLQEAPNSP